MPAYLLHSGDKQPTNASPEGPVSKVEQISPQRPRVVIIEDEFLVAWNLQAQLRDWDFDFCEIASDAESGVDLAVSQEAELLIVDVNLGEGPDGVEAVRRILQCRKAVAIFITAYTDETNLNRILRVAPQAPVLAKPFSSDLLFSTIEKLFPRLKG